MYDPLELSYRDLLRAFFKLHNPTGRGSRQYMSLVLFESPDEKAVRVTHMRVAVMVLGGRWRRPW